MKKFEVIDQIINDVVNEEAERADKDGVWMAESMRALQEAKLTGLVVPLECGGMGEGLFSLAKICEQLGKAYGSVGLCFGMHCVGTAVIAAKATDWQKEHYLTPIAAGKHLTTLALSEPGTGAHFYFPQTSLLALSPEEYLVNGDKSFVTNGGHSNSYVLSTMAASDEASLEQFSCIMIDEGMPGMAWGKDWNGLGMRGNASRSLHLTNLKIPQSHILGNKGDQLWYIFTVVAPYFLTAMAGTYLGIAARALEEATITLAKRSYSFNGSSLAQVPLLQYRLGTLWAKVERSRRLIYYAAQAADMGDPDALPAILSCKAEVADGAVETVNEAMTLAGGIGYQTDGILGRLLRDVRAAHVMAPTTDMLYTWIGRSLLDQPILSE